jgi:hypothetical protein
MMTFVMLTLAICSDNKLAFVRLPIGSIWCYRDTSRVALVLLHFHFAS